MRNGPCLLFGARKSDIYEQNTHTHTQSRTENSLFQFSLTIAKPLSLSYPEEMKNHLSLVISRTVNQLIMRVRKPKVEYKLALQEKTQGSILTYY